MSDEVITTNTATGGQKGVKLARFDLIPAGPLMALAEHYGKGSRKYADRNWEKGYEWGKSFAAMQRHAWLFWQGEDYDVHKPDCPVGCLEHTGSHHLTAVAWHAFALMEWARTHPELDTRSCIDRINESVAPFVPPAPARKKVRVKTDVPKGLPHCYERGLLPGSVFELHSATDLYYWVQLPGEQHPTAWSRERFEEVIE